MIDVPSVQYFIQLVNHKAETEVRLIDPHKKIPTVQNWVKPKDLLKIAEENDGKVNVYAGLHERKSQGAEDQHVITVDKFFIDIDSKHPQDQAATDEELNLSREVANSICQEFKERGWGEPAMAMSGNGYQIVKRFPPIEAPTKVIADKIKALEREFIDKYSNGKARIDTMSNFSRIIKVWGTTSVKGDNTQDRPYRTSTLIQKDSDPSQKLRDDILLMETKAQIVYVETPKLSNNKNNLEDAMSKDSKLRRLMDGDESGYKSTSEAEAALCEKLVYWGFDDSEIDNILITKSKLDKWRDASKSYKELTLKKAHEWVKNTSPVMITEKQDFPDSDIPVTPTLADVHRIYQKWLCTKDLKRIDAGLAVGLTRGTKGTRVWLIIVGPSGDWKSEQLSAFEDPEISKLVSRITPRTLLSGDKEATDLAPKLDNKIFLIKDMAQIMTLKSEDKAAIWAQLRDLYDGKMSLAAGTGVDKTIEANVTLLAGTTPVIDEQILVGQALGTRELIYRTDMDNPDTIESIQAIMDKTLANEEFKEQMAHEIKLVTLRFLKTHQYQNTKVPKEVEMELKRKAMFIRLMRAVGETDYDGNLRNVVYPEMPTRVLMQFKKFFMALKCLDPEYSDEQALAVLDHIAKSVTHPVRIRVLKTLESNKGEHSTNFIANAAKVGYKSASSHLNILEAVGMAKKTFKEEVNSFGKVIETVTWEYTTPDYGSLARE